jgi:hypothetical protein
MRTQPNASLLSVRGLGLAIVVLLVLLVRCGPADAASGAAGWTLNSFAVPTHFSTIDASKCGFGSEEEQLLCGYYEIAATNAGSVSTAGDVALTDTPPVGVTVHKAELFLVENGNTIRSGSGGNPGGTTVALGECELNAPVVCTTTKAVPPDYQLMMRVYVGVSEPEHVGEHLVNNAMVSGGGAATVSMTSENEVNPAPAAFGLSGFAFYKSAANGTEELQAGGHPYELTTTIDLATAIQHTPEDTIEPTSIRPVKDVVVDLPLGFAGSTLAVPECTEAQLDSETHCPTDTIVGHIRTEPYGRDTAISSPIYNISPEFGHPAEFGFTAPKIKASLIAGYVSVVPSSMGYVLRFVASDLPEITLKQLVVTFYGDPVLKDAETRQQQQELELKKPVALEAPSVQPPFFTDPSSCLEGPQVAKIWLDSWTDPAKFQPGSGELVPSDLEEPAWAKSESVSPVVTGCDALSFTPEFEAQPTTHEADSPSGLTFGLKVPQTSNVSVPATPALRNIRVTLPEGMTVDPSAADGLGVCSEAQIGYQGPSLFDFTEARPECPESSKIGLLELESPDIPGVLHGEMFLAAQDENPFGATFATYVVVNDPTTGVVVKLAGELKLNPTTGQITATFDENPQLPFSNLKLRFFGGPRATLATPARCGIYTTTSEMEPWSFEGTDLPATPFNSYIVDENCPGGFSPGFTALGTNVAAGADTDVEASVSREDQEPELGGVSVSLPEGLLADVASVPLCGEAQANGGTCPGASLVGTTEASAGPGPDPVSVKGNVYLTGPYNGGPYGLSVVVDADPGPFNFGLVVVRQSLRINPITAAVTDVSNAFPTILDPKGPNGETNGVPIKLRRVNVDIDRPGFAFNPTSCDKTAVTAAITATNGATSSKETSFQLTNCQHLKFEPKLTVTAAGKGSKKDGTSLNFKITYPKNAIGQQTWFNETKFDFPKQLPARLTTLQKACLSTVFETNRAACPAASIIGHATVHTPILTEPLMGPVYFVSYGGAKFPEAVIVLQGDNITIDLHGETFIAKNGQTSATFHNLPDTPFESIEVSIPSGPYSEFTANVPAKDYYSLCGQKLVMPTLLKAADGTQIDQNTTITTTGCTKTTTKAKKSKRSNAEKSRARARPGYAKLSGLH